MWVSDSLDYFQDQLLSSPIRLFITRICWVKILLLGIVNTKLNTNVEFEFGIITKGHNADGTKEPEIR
jgi:hypothetical protein